MSEKRFIQLVNLQIDGEISESELQELEKEIASDSEREAIYQSYLRLQEASQIVSSQFGEALSETVDLRKYQILARDSDNWRRGFFYSASALAAACAAVAAAIGFFPEIDWNSSTVRTIVAQDPVAVEVYEPAAVSHPKANRLHPLDNSRALPSPNSRFSSDLPGISVQFEETNSPATWNASFPTGSSSAVIYNNTSFESTGPVSIQFTR